MWISRDAYLALVSRSVDEQRLAAAERRAEVAEAALATERKERMADVRHVLSQWLRHERTYPLPPTAEEKAEKKAERANVPPPTLTADQLARRQAVRDWAKREGLSQEDADKAFMAQLGQQVETE